MTDLPARFSAADRSSFAYKTVKDRLPIILTKVVDLLSRERDNLVAQYGPEGAEHAKQVIGRLAKLKNEMQTDKQFIPITDNLCDVIIWNEYLKEELDSVGTAQWFASSWLYAECYMYRRMYEAFQLSAVLQSYDYFGQQKEDGFFASKHAMQQLGSYLQCSFKVMQVDKESLFKQLLEISLWGNRCDLSISAGADNAQTENPVMALPTLKPSILAEDTATIWNTIQKANKQNSDGVQVDIVLDNAGFELFCDLCFAHFLCESQLVSRINFYVKEMPWFVSDTTVKDFCWTIDTLINMDNEDTVLGELGLKWRTNITDRKWVFQLERFWTLPYDYSEMRSVDENLYTKLSMADLIIFKGDLNYRKLTGDRRWEYTTPFEVALNGFHPSALCVLRTIKADVVVGLKPEVADKTEAMSPNWLTSGEYAVIQCCTNKS